VSLKFRKFLEVRLALISLKESSVKSWAIRSVGQLEMIVALGADLEIIGQVLGIDRLAAFITLDPQVAGDIKSFAGVFGLFLQFLALKPIVDAH
jgi:hypothetical protein